MAELSNALTDFRAELDTFFKAQKKHNSTRQRLQDVYLRVLQARNGSAAVVVSDAGHVTAVGIAGVGKSSESPDSKGSKAKRQAISLQELGGEAAVREMIIQHLARQRQVTVVELRNSLQDVWVDEISDKTARVSVLLSKPKPECTQLALQREDARWRIVERLRDEDSAKATPGVLRDLWSPVAAREVEAGRLLEDMKPEAEAEMNELTKLLSQSLKGVETSKSTKGPNADMPKKLVGKSPFFRPKDVAKLFEEIDADGDGQLSKDDMLPFLRDYLGYGHAEVLNFLEAHRGENLGIQLADFKRGLKDLNAYAVHNRENQLIVRKPQAFGGIEGVDFHLEDCTGCTCLICDSSEEFKVDALKNCRVLIGPCRSSSFIRNCENCTFWVATKQFRVRDCINCTFYLHCHTEPVIEASKDLRIAPFHAKYPGLKKQFQDAGFDSALNFWNAVYDFTGNSKHANWTIPSLDECEELIVSFEGSTESPEAVCELTQELLLAPPLESSESHGQSVSSVPQTRPAAPATPSLKRLRRCISDASQDLAGLLEAVILSDEVPQKDVKENPEVEILDLDDDVDRSQVPTKEWSLGPSKSSFTASSASQKARAANAWAADRSMLAPGGAEKTRSRPLGGLRLTSGSTAEKDTKSKAPSREAEALQKILNDSSDDDMIFAPRNAAKVSSSGSTAKASSAAARQKFSEKIGVLMSSLDSDEEEKPSTIPGPGPEHQSLGLPKSGAKDINPASSSEDEIIVEDETRRLPITEAPKSRPLPKKMPKKADPGSGSSTSESDGESFARWQKTAAAARPNLFD